MGLTKHKRKSRLKAIRWTVSQASSEFKIHPETLARRIKTGGIEAGHDGLYSTLDVARAIYGDMDEEKLRDKRLDADLKEIEKAQKLRQFVPADLVARAWGNVIDNLRVKISYSQISDLAKQEMVADLQNLPIDDYFATTNKDAEVNPESDPDAA